MDIEAQMDSPELSPIRTCILVAVVSVSISLFICAARQLGFLQTAEMLFYDASIAFSADAGPASDVVLVPIEEQDLTAWGWPVPNGKLASIVSALSGAGAVAIGVDIYRDSPDSPDENQLAMAFANSSAVAIYKLGPEGGVSIEPPVYAAKSGNVGFSDMPQDFDGLVRRALLLVSDDLGVRQSFALRLANQAMAQSQFRPWPEDPSVLMFGAVPVPRLESGFGAFHSLDDAGYQILVDFQNDLPIAASIPARDILSGKIDPAAIARKVAIVGVTSESVKDYFRTPLNRSAPAAHTYGIQLHAAVIQQILNYSKGIARPVRSPSAITQTLLLLVAALLGSMPALLSRAPILALLLGFGATTAIGGIMAFALRWGMWLPAAPASLASLSGFLVTFSILAALARKQQKLALRLFSNHLSPRLAGEVWKNRDIILSGGRPLPMRLFSTVLFSDLAGSTRIGGSAEPGAYMDWISNFLDRMSAVAQLHGGFVEKYTGDGIMVVFGAPLPSIGEAKHRHDAEAACACALAMAETVDQMNEGPCHLAPYRIRIGLHSGEVLGGTIGTSGSMRYNIIGDSANVASRVEAYGKRIQDQAVRATTICLTHRTAELAQRIVDVRPIGTLTHDDQKYQLEIFELLGMKAGQ